jgi:hypothetical protein
MVRRVAPHRKRPGDAPKRGKPSYSAVWRGVKEQNGPVRSYCMEGSRVIRRIAGVIARPRATLAGLIAAPAWVSTWSAILFVWAVCGGWLLSTEVGQQALVDERVRVIETFGGSVSDSQYAALLASPPWWVYLTSGSRTWLTPPVTLIVALGVWLVARLERAPASLAQALAIVVHTSIVLVVGQLLATPLHYVRESLTNPLNLAAILPLMEEGTPPTRFFGTMDFFALWWMALIALGLSILTGQRLGRYLLAMATLYGLFAAVLAVVIEVTGG